MQIIERNNTEREKPSERTASATRKAAPDGKRRGRKKKSSKRKEVEDGEVAQGWFWG
jgi:DNA invertase Pin-like site-specific DNA recombinase